MQKISFIHLISTELANFLNYSCKISQLTKVDGLLICNDLVYEATKELYLITITLIWIKQIKHKI